MSFFNGFKEKTVSLGMKMFLQRYVQRYGEIKDLDVDLKKRKIHCSLLLKGEDKPLDLELWEIRTQAVGGKYYLEFDRITVSREWIDTLVKEYLPKVLKDNRVEIPETAGKGLMMLKIV